MKRGSLGMIETWGFTPAVEAADTGLKAANVRLLACLLTRPALITVAFTGDVAAVSTAVGAAAAATARVGRVVATHVIARPDASLLDRLAGDPAPAPAETSPDVPPVVDAEAKTGAGDTNEEKKPAAPEPVAISTAETRQSKQTASRSKPAAVKKRASKKNLKGSAKEKAPKAPS